MATKVQGPELISVDEHKWEMNRLRTELRDRMSKEYFKGFWVGTVLTSLGSIAGIVIVKYFL